MPEAIGVLARELRPVGPHELAPDERRQRRAQLGLGRRQRLHRAAMERSPLDGAAFEHRALGRIQLVEAGAQQRLDRRRHGHLSVGRVTDEADHLLDEERVPLGRPEDPAAQRMIDLGAVEQALDELLGVACREGLQQHGRRVQLAAAPVRPAVEQLGARHAEQQDRGVAAQVGDVIDEVEERVLAPVNVVEDGDERRAARLGLEQSPHCPGDLLAEV